MDERRERRYFTRGFARAIAWGVIVFYVPTFLAAILLWNDGAPDASEFTLAAISVAAAGAGGWLANTRLPRHPVASEAMRNGAIAGLGVVGVGYLVALLLAFSERNGWGKFSPIGLDLFAAFFVGWILPMGLASAISGAVTGRLRSRPET